MIVFFSCETFVWYVFYEGPHNVRWLWCSCFWSLDFELSCSKFLFVVELQLSEQMFQLSLAALFKFEKVHEIQNWKHSKSKDNWFHWKTKLCSTKYSFVGVFSILNPLRFKNLSPWRGPCWWINSKAYKYLKCGNVSYKTIKALVGKIGQRIKLYLLHTQFILKLIHKCVHFTQTNRQTYV